MQHERGLAKPHRLLAPAVRYCPTSAHPSSAIGKGVSLWLSFLSGCLVGIFLGVRWATRRAALITPPVFAPLLSSRLRLRYRSPQALLRLLAPEPTWVVLDAGCGNGAFALPLAPHVREVHAVDVQPAMLCALQRRLEAHRVDNIQARLAPLTHLPYPDAVFDAALLISVLPMVHDRAGVLSELWRVLKPGAVLLVGEDWLEPEYVPERTARAWVTAAGFLAVAAERRWLSYTVKFVKPAASSCV
ncbi:MAG: methyltransferase domain-containing protein [Anaerolineae bacterium]|nr:methyltransferase domain-containing protein [Anaerolineae bacterium]